jgi:MoxR-like ATPase
LIKVSLGYPDMSQEAKIISMNINGEKELLRPVADAADIAALKKEVTAVFVDESVKKYIVEIVAATRSNPDVLLGASPRGSISLYNICQAHAVYLGRDYVIPDDVKLLAPYVLSHRLILTHEAKISKTPVERIIDQILSKTPVPAIK